MNKCVFMGRLTRDPEARYSNGENATAVVNYQLAVTRKYPNKDGNYEADFIPCVALGKIGEFAEKYFRQGMRVAVSGRLQTGSYTNREGKKVYTTNLLIEEQEFAENRSEQEARTGAGKGGNSGEDGGFMNIPDDIEDEVPFR